MQRRIALEREQTSKQKNKHQPHHKVTVISEPSLHQLLGLQTFHNCFCALLSSIRNRFAQKFLNFSSVLGRIVLFLFKNSVAASTVQAPSDFLPLSFLPVDEAEKRRFPYPQKQILQQRAHLVRRLQFSRVWRNLSH